MPESVNQNSSIHNPQQGDGNTSIVLNDTLGVIILGIVLIILVLGWLRLQERQPISDLTP